MMANQQLTRVFKDVREGLKSSTIVRSDSEQSSPSGTYIKDLVKTLTPGSKPRSRPDIAPSKAVMRRVDLSEPQGNVTFG